MKWDIFLFILGVLFLTASIILTILLIQTKKRLQQTHNQLFVSEKMASLGKMVAGISHDINTKLGVCISAISFLRDSQKEIQNHFDKDLIKKSELEKHLETEQESLQITMLNLEEASNLVESLKDISIAQAQETIFPFNLKSYFEKILLSMQPRLKKTNHSIDLSCDSSLQVKMNPGLLSQVLTNLINNSLIHGFENKDKGEITIQAEKEEEDLLLLYSDNGKGIQKQHLSRIFQPYFTTKKEEGGSGLGLSIIYSLITKESGGSITCSSIPGEKTTFFIRLPKVNAKYSKENLNES